MAQKSNPIILRLLKTNRYFDGCWFNNSNYVYLLMRDLKIRNYINGILKAMNVSSARFLIQNLHNKQKINVFFCNLEKTRKHMNRALKQTSPTSPTKTRKLNVHRTLLYKNNNRLTSTESANPQLRTKKLGHIAFDLHSKKFTELQGLKLHEKTDTFFTHDKIFSFLNKHLRTSVKQANKSRKLLLSHEYVSSIQNNLPIPITDFNIYNIISEKQNVGTCTSKYSLLNDRIKESYTIEKLQSTFLRYFIIKYYLLNTNNAFSHNKLNLLPEFRDQSCRTKLNIRKNESIFAHTNFADNVTDNHFYKSYDREFNIKYLLKTRLDFMCSKQHEIFPIIKHFILQNQKKKILFSFMKHQKQYYITNKIFSREIYVENVKFQSKNVLNNLNKVILPNSKKYTIATNIQKNKESLGTATYKKKLVLNYNFCETERKTDVESRTKCNRTGRLEKQAPLCTTKKTDVLFPLHVAGAEHKSLLEGPTRIVRTLNFLDDKKNSRLHSKFFTFSKSSSFSNYMEHSCLPVSYSLKNANLKIKNLAFCNKLMFNCNETFNILMKKIKLPCLYTENKDNLDLHQIKNNNRNFIHLCNMDVSMFKYVIIACINKQYLYTTYNDYCNVFIANSNKTLFSDINTRKNSFLPSPEKLVNQVALCLKTETPVKRVVDQQNEAAVSCLRYKSEKLTSSLVPHKQKTAFKKLDKTMQNEKLKLLIPNSGYKQHMECVIQKNFLSPNPINLHFFTSTNIFQNATYLMDIFIYYLEKKQPFFKLKNMVLKQLTELKPLIVKGVLVQCSGRVAMKSKKAQKAKIQTFKYGETGLHVFNSKLDFKSSKAFTSFGTIGIKIWICYF